MNSGLEAICFSVRRYCRYHARRKAFYENMHKIFTFIIIIISSGSVLGLCAEFSNSAFIQQVSSVVVTILATLDLVIGFSVKAKEHEILYRRFCDLHIRMADSTEFENDFVKDRLEIEKDEFPIYRALNLLCHNEEARAIGSKEIYKLGRCESLFRHFWRFSDIQPEMLLMH
jgi:hypothetical protein